MSNEDPNNTSPWRNKLDELEHLPGSAFNRDAAWDKLYGRFQGNKKSKKIFWYWIAAACLLFGCDLCGGAVFPRGTGAAIAGVCAAGEFAEAGAWRGFCFAD